MTASIRLLPALALLCLLHAPAASANWYHGNAAILEDEVLVEFWHDNAELAPRCMDMLRTEMARVNAMIDVSDPDSAISSINAAAADDAVKVSTELHSLIDKALRFGPVTRGAFDITFASVGFLFDYEQRQRPDIDATGRALEVVDYRLVETNRRARTIRFKKPGMKIDISGIAKGHAVDRAVKMLIACGATNALVSAGGDTRALGDRRGEPWTVGVRNPKTAGSDVVAWIPVIDQGVSTSGDYERFFEQDGERYHQIINPRTGDSPSDVRSVTVIGPDGIWCDALATGIFVLGIIDGLDVIESLDGYEAFIVDHRGGRHLSSGMTTTTNP
ncbi:MAG: FAD:protein FMN transferase [Gammaproteobacteria bacterium]|nr:FAD:protein FMN transferase [Gammaproteobacteria bacterium]